MGYQLEFEKPLLQLEEQIAVLESHQQQAGHAEDFNAEIKKLRQSHATMLKKTYGKLNAWQTVQVARHPARPQSVDYIGACVKDFCELHGDRRFGDDPAITTGFGRIGPYKVLLVAHQKGKDTRQKIACHFGCAHPEGYRKALSKMKLAEKFGLPVVTLIDTPGAYPGIGAEERGQAEAIALNLREMSRLKVPIVSIVIGEGGSGGALGIGVADRIAMMQYAWYSVISPEGCAAILWKTGAKAADAAEQLHLTARENVKIGTIDEVIDEPLGGAHRDPKAAYEKVEAWIVQTLRDLNRFKIDNLVKRRYEKFRNMGQFAEA
ncbi:MAG: acetyl-CoA carboxylase carboxyltransferase subunit alpha [Phycisphaera sp.]|nr:acetyl-CoA carboxylase carboxyltransferase subunit alpha [Phycisphaera sp.]